MTMRSRFVLEGTWSGYTSRQTQVCHREVISAKRAERLVLRAIRFDDGTSLWIATRPAARGEKVETKGSYTDLIRDAEAFQKSHVSVAEICEREAKAREAVTS